MPIFQRADANKNATVTLDELLAGATSVFKEVDADKSGALDEQELSKAFDVVFPRPQGPGGGFGGFGPPGFAPPGAGPANGNRDGRPAPRGGDNNSGQERRP